MANPIRLVAMYGSARALVTEYTRSIARGGAVLPARRPIAPGSRFLVEMGLPDLPDALELEGRVVHVVPTDAGFDIGVTYSRCSERRDVIDQLVARIGVDATYDVVRKHARIPVSLVAQAGPGFDVAIRDLSRGGMQLECDAFPVDVQRGGRAEMTVQLAGHQFELGGTVVWVRDRRAGVMFDALDDAQQMLLDALLHLVRPDCIDLVFAPARRFARGTRNDDSIGNALMRRLFDAAAREHLACLGPLQVVREPDALHVITRDSRVARVAIRGDIQLELVLEVNAQIAARLASALLDIEVAPEAHALVDDALAETLTAIAGGACDVLETPTRRLDVSPPLHEQLVPSAGDLVHGLVLESVYGIVRLTMVLRDPGRPS